MVINFIAGGMMGDFIHSLFVVKNICLKKNAKANIYITDDSSYGCGIWKYSIDKSYNDVFDLVINQPYVNKFEILSEKISEYVNLNSWREYAVNLAHEEFGFKRCWSDILCKNYNIELPKEYKWIALEPNNEFKDMVLIHRSIHRHNIEFPWSSLIDSVDGDILFLTTSRQEFDSFPFKSNKIKPQIVGSISEMAIIIGSCKYFIGNQSAPFAIASSMDVPRLVELGEVEGGFYMGENKYSENISWYFNNSEKHLSHNSIFKKV